MQDLNISLIQTVTLGCSALAMTGLLLLGMTPVSWLFSVSTNSLRFVVIMNVVAWAVSIGFVFRFFRTLQFAPDGKKTAGIKWWLCVYVVVSLQMATVMRPLLGRPPVDAPRPKTFFLAHFTHCMKEAPRDASRHP